MQKLNIFTPGRLLGIVLGTIVVLLMSRIGGAAYAFQLPPTPTQTSSPTMTPTPKSAVSIIMNETYVNALVRSQMADNPNVTNPVVDLRPPNLALVTLTMRLPGGLSVRPTATIAFVVQNNRIIVNIQRVDVGNINVPRVLIENQLLALQTQLENQLNQVTHPLDSSILELNRISATETELTVDLGFRPQTGLVPETGGTANITPFPIVTSTPSSVTPTPGTSIVTPIPTLTPTPFGF